MATYRKIHTSFWGDPFIQDLTPEQKYFFLYLLTNEKTAQCGIYEISKKQMCYDTGYNIDTVLKLINFFSDCQKVMFSESTNEIAIRNWQKYNGSDSSTVQILVNQQLSEVKNRVLIEYLYSTDTISPTNNNITRTITRTITQTGDSDLNFDFLVFWNLYDKKIGSIEKLKKKWEKLTNEERQNAMDYIPKYKDAQPIKQYRKNAETFLNNKSWNDELIFKENGKQDQRIAKSQIGKPGRILDAI